MATLILNYGRLFLSQASGDMATLNPFLGLVSLSPSVARARDGQGQYNQSVRQDTPRAELEAAGWTDRYE
jgi:hypothetical protein